jgi:anti-anti-sigma factor
VAAESHTGTPFSVAVGAQGADVVVTVEGEIDISTVGELGEAVAPGAPGGRLVIDLRPVSFIDSSGIRLLMALQARSAAEGWSFAVARAADGHVQRVFEMCRLGDRVLVVDDPADLPAP